MARTSATRPIVVVPPSQPGIETVVATGNWDAQTAWPHFTAFAHPRKLHAIDRDCHTQPRGLIGIVSVQAEPHLERWKL